MSKPTEVQEEEMFGRITNRIDALIKGNANFEFLKSEIRRVTDSPDLADNAIVAQVASGHEAGKMYGAARENIATQEIHLTALNKTVDDQQELVLNLGEKLHGETKRADDLQAEKDLIAEKLGLIEEEPEPLVEPPETADDAPAAHAPDGMDHDDEAANADPAPDDEGE